MKKNYYLTPQLEIIEIETEDAVLASSNTSTSSVADYDYGASWGSSN